MLFIIGKSWIHLKFCAYSRVCDVGVDLWACKVLLNKCLNEESVQKPDISFILLTVDKVGRGVSTWAREKGLEGRLPNR